MIDNGAMHNFVAERVVKEPNIPVKGANFIVPLRDSKKAKGVKNVKDYN